MWLSAWLIVVATAGEPAPGTGAVVQPQPQLGPAALAQPQHPPRKLDPFERAEERLREVYLAAVDGEPLREALLERLVAVSHAWRAAEELAAAAASLAAAESVPDPRLRAAVAVAGRDRLRSGVSALAELGDQLAVTAAAVAGTQPPEVQSALEVERAAVVHMRGRLDAVLATWPVAPTEADCRAARAVAVEAVARLEDAVGRM